MRFTSLTGAAAGLLLLPILAFPARAVVEGTPLREPDGLRRSVVAVESSSGELCSGALVAQDLVLTAAHCMTDRAAYRIVAVNRAFKPQAVRVAAIAVHPTFVPGTTPRTQPGVDLALLKLERPLGADFGPFDLRQAEGIPEGATVTVAGFGVLSERLKNSARTLRQTELLAVGAVQVANRVVIAADRNRLAETAGAGACRGDSGGPVLTRSQGGYRLSGIVSWSSGALRTNGPSACGGLTAVTSLADHMGWIRQATASLDGMAGSWTRR
ncbi:S1 family peptidase [Microvirga thermotolerans]|uniref:Trypsin-like serine protease n=1 Tax=Microvirga thermotolerans TaxID=2651334 RepID=A0A5P9JZN0_9HYPH|nr:trypsin-like serine protease [Microvirga thermotolerans]QFU17086.1 trypsin-like serine protease [Microvirga thermotolerans]